ncbi:hypothetical protein ACWGIB_07575 [Streptomyces xiamenensis]
MRNGIRALRTEIGKSCLLPRGSRVAGTRTFHDGRFAHGVASNRWC